MAETPFRSQVKEGASINELFQSDTVKDVIALG